MAARYKKAGMLKMNHVQRKNPFWHLAGPLLGYWLIQAGVQFMMTTIIEMPYLMEMYEKYLSAGAVIDTQKLMADYMNAMVPAMQETLKRQVEIAGAAALCTIPLTGILFYHDRKMERGAEEDRAKRAGLLSYWKLIVLGAAGSIGASCLISMAGMAFSDTTYLEESAVVYSAPVAVQILVLGVVIPVAEELMFRGLLFGRYKSMRGYWYAALWSSLFFALIHTNVLQMAYALGLGVMLCYVYRKYHSFIAPVVLHVTANMTSILMTMSGGFDWIGSDLLRIAGGAIAGAFLCSVIFVLIQRMPEAEPDNKSAKKKAPSDLI